MFTIKKLDYINNETKHNDYVEKIKLIENLNEKIFYFAYQIEEIKSEIKILKWLNFKNRNKNKRWRKKIKYFILIT